MNIQKIKERANQVLEMNKAQYIRILIILILLGLIPGLFNTGQSSLLYAIISLVFLTLSHGYVVSSLKMVRNQAHLLSDDDAFVGFKRIKELFDHTELTGKEAMLYMERYQQMLVFIGRIHRERSPAE